MKAVKGLHPAAVALAKEIGLDGGDNAIIASTGEFLLEGLYVNNRCEQVQREGEDVFQAVNQGIAVHRTNHAIL